MDATPAPQLRTLAEWRQLREGENDNATFTHYHKSPELWSRTSNRLVEATVYALDGETPAEMSASLPVVF